MKRLTIGIAAGLCALAFTGITPAFGGLPGNTCDSAVEAITGENPFDTSNMTDSGFGDPDENQCLGTWLDWVGENEDVWFSWTPPCDGTASFSTCDIMSFDTSMVLYVGDTCDTAVQIACNGDGQSSSCQPYYSLIEGIPVTAGQKYYIRIGSYQGNSVGPGTLTIGVEISGGACCYNGTECTDCVSPEECEEGGGVFLGEGSTCDNEGASCAPGACCYDGELCQDDMAQNQCVDWGGVFLGAGSTCDDEGYTCNTGACCWSKDMDCGYTSQSNCVNSGGTWYGYGSTCEDDAPNCTPGPPGACCIGGDCYQVSTYECTVNGGSWVGGDCTECSCWDCGTCCIGTQCWEDYPYDACELNDGTWLGNVSCSENPCAVDVGACCYGETCVEFSNSNGEEFCHKLLNGTWMGNGTLCAEVNCAIGACCHEDLDGNLSCGDGYTEDDCSLAGGDYLGDYSTCADEGSWCVTVLGACCFDGFNCSDGINSTECEEWGGYFYGGGTTCDDEGSYCQVGACCINDYGYPYCVESSIDECWSNDGNWYGYGTTCKDAPDCDPGSYGACCMWGECAQMYQSECTWAGGSWAGGSCDSCTCTQCGTCCFGETCEEDVTNEHCEGMGGTWMGNLSCTDDLCAPRHLQAPAALMDNARSIPRKTAEASTSAMTRPAMGTPVMETRTAPSWGCSTSSWAKTSWMIRTRPGPSTCMPRSNPAQGSTP